MSKQLPECVRLLDGDARVTVQPHCFFWGSMSREVATALCDLVLAREDLFPNVGKRHEIVELAESLRAVPDEDAVDGDDYEQVDDIRATLHMLTMQVLEVFELFIEQDDDARYTDGQWLDSYALPCVQDVAGLWAIFQAMARYSYGYLWVTTDQQHMVPGQVWLWQFTTDGKLIERRFVERIIEPFVEEAPH